MGPVFARGVRRGERVLAGKGNSRRLRRYCGSGPSCGQPSALQMMGEN